MSHSDMVREQGRIQSLERGVYFAEKVEEQNKNKQKKVIANNGCPLLNVHTIKILIQILIHSFIKGRFRGGGGSWGGLKHPPPPPPPKFYNKQAELLEV